MHLWNLYLGITRLCTLECEHCLRGNRRNEYMSLETIDNAFKDVKEIDTLLLTGGEPLLAIKQIKEILKQIKKNNVKVHRTFIITNCTFLNEEIIEILKEFSDISELELALSYDVFHYVELKRLNLLEKRINNARILKEIFGAYDYASFEDKTRKKRNIIKAGRAESLTEERLKEFSDISEKDYILADYRILDRPFAPYYEEETGLVYDKVYVDVNGNVTDIELSFDEEDNEVDKYISNINEIGLLESILNYRIYSLETHNANIEEYKKVYDKFMQHIKSQNNSYEKTK